MPLNVQALKDWVFEDRRQTYTDKDTMLYALSVGFGADPLDPLELPFVYEKNLRAMPSMAATLCHLGAWIGDARTGATKSKIVHGEQRMRFHAPLPAAADLVARSRVLGVEDKGADKGALVHVERAISNATSGELLVTITHTSFCRADGGFGESFGPTLQLHTLPERAPDHVAELIIAPDAALLYRLNVDRNPLHADPEVAQRAGFERPILHGLCSYGMAARSMLGQWLDYDASRMGSLDVRFSSVVFPGETLQVQSWRDGDVLSFKALVPARGKTVLDNGRIDVV
ncbi:3-alpha,7-alpha,12-alpha-trihydroxy-5-beta-cholest-24-enoyl-CoA hydratase [Lampropedia puyangensis]|uniref:3-alpha,7-alpha, 12-alpha-trihydroxy-5-beta-cholest-24-enoyl-CoA hydratase n=1 Tax=Lampropedia puyangensis TaxID=1330072 RepID=A0A4S8ENS6_9BURK|nr:MaoC/PaaZ C-terminal domain-containing protein [Lampropedia puyangensis]THT96302.1 3-alpha,7-alpha,12-alpha-trihydroxy-5-beta-cholest-24-enoyl-CoA hydratase [Lampropedia puyangensis]